MASPAVILTAAAAVAAPTALLALPAVASADATGCTSFGNHTVWGHTFPSGVMCGSVIGSGTYVDGIGGTAAFAGPICNYRFVGTFYTNYNQYVRTVATPQQNRCNWNTGLQTAGLYAYVPSGRVVITLQSAGIPVASITEYIQP